MCDQTLENIGELVPDNVVIYRACPRSTYLSRSKDAVEAPAFQKDGRNHTDGLSCTLTADESIRHVDSHGVVSILVRDIHQLGRELEVRYDTANDGHVLIRNLPCMDREAEERELAEAVASELAVRAEVQSVARTKKLVAAPPTLPNT
jgi:hypothetical protein